MCVFGLWEYLEKAHVRMRRTAKHHIDCGAKRYLLKAIFDCVGESDLIYSIYSFYRDPNVAVLELKYVIFLTCGQKHFHTTLNARIHAGISNRK